MRNCQYNVTTWSNSLRKKGLIRINVVIKATGISRHNCFKVLQYSKNLTRRKAIASVSITTSFLNPNTLLHVKLYNSQTAKKFSEFFNITDKNMCTEIEFENAYAQGNTKIIQHNADHSNWVNNNSSDLQWILCTFSVFSNNGWTVINCKKKSVYLSNALRRS